LSGTHDGEGGRGGDGIVSSITGEAVTYAVGGSGVQESNFVNDPNDGATGQAGDGPAGTGSGGNGADNENFPSGDGGSGIVIIRYRIG